LFKRQLPTILRSRFFVVRDPHLVIGNLPGIALSLALNGDSTRDLFGFAALVIKRVLGIVLLMLSSGPAYAEWMSLGSSESGTTVYADPATMRRGGDLVKMLVLFDFKSKQTKSDISYLSAKVEMEYDCAEQRFEGHAVLYYSGNMGNGQLLDRSSGKGRRLRALPGSLDHDLWKLACGKK